MIVPHVIVKNDAILYKIPKPSFFVYKNRKIPIKRTGKPIDKHDIKIV